MKAGIYEIGKDGRLVPCDESAGASVAVGDVLHWAGNMGFPAQDFAVLEINKERKTLQCYAVEHPENNARLHCVEWHSVKRADDPSLWHGQHHFITGRKIEPAHVLELWEDHKRQQKAQDEAAAASLCQRTIEIEKGRALWAKLAPAGCQFVIVAEKICDDSDPMTDYFGEHTEDKIILAFSKHGRDLFAEMRKAAAKFGGTAHLGPGMGDFSPVVVCCDSFRCGGSSYHDGYFSPFHRELMEDENGRRLHFSTLAEAEKYICEKGEPIKCGVDDGKTVSFRWIVREEKIEHREKYSMGKGYYLQAWGNPWRVSKESATGWTKGGEVSEDILIALAGMPDIVEQ